MAGIEGEEGGEDADCWCVRDGGGALGELEASSITVTSTLFFGDEDLDFGQGGKGDPRLEDPSGDGRSIEGDGDREGEIDLKAGCLN